MGKEQTVLVTKTYKWHKEVQISYEMVNTKIKIKSKFWNINGKTKTTLDFKGQNELSLKDMQYVS